MADQIGMVGLMCAVFTFIGTTVRIVLELMKFVPCGCQNIVNCQEVPDCKPLTLELSLDNRLWLELLDTFIIAISIIVCAIPEGLPLAVTISLSYSS